MEIGWLGGKQAGDRVVRDVHLGPRPLTRNPFFGQQVKLVIGGAADAQHRIISTAAGLFGPVVISAAYQVQVVFAFAKTAGERVTGKILALTVGIGPDHVRLTGPWCLHPTDDPWNVLVVGILVPVLLITNQFLPTHRRINSLKRDQAVAKLRPVFKRISRSAGRFITIIGGRHSRQKIIDLCKLNAGITPPSTRASTYDKRPVE